MVLTCLLASRHAHAHLSLGDWWCAASAQAGGPGRAASEQDGALLLFSKIRICRDGAGVSPGQQACPCSTVLRRLVVRSICVGGGTRACSV